MEKNKYSEYENLELPLDYYFEKNDSGEEENEYEKIKITIGTSGKIEIDGKVIKIKPKTIKVGAILNTARKDFDDIKYIDFKLKKENYPPDIVKMIHDALSVSKLIPIDFTVIHSVFKAKISGMEKKQIIESYLKTIIKSEYEYIKTQLPEEAEKIKGYVEQDTNNILEVIYDMKDLSKPSPFIGTLLSLHPERRYLSGDEKGKIVEYANKAYRYGVGKTIGQYKYNDEYIFSKILGIFKKNKRLLLEPYDMKTIDYTQRIIPEEIVDKDELNAAYEYNTIRNKAIEQNRDIKEVFDENGGDIHTRIASRGYNKVVDLIASQELQEKNNSENENEER